MGYKSKLGGCLFSKNQNPKRWGEKLPIIKSLLWAGGGSIAYKHKKIYIPMQWTQLDWPRFQIGRVPTQTKIRTPKGWGKVTHDEKLIMSKRMHSDAV